MPAIYLIRHGQASFGKADYDQLSERGIQQAQLLGKFWRSCASVDRLYLGDLLRHSQTAEHFLGGYKASEVPTIITLALMNLTMLTCSLVIMISGKTLLK
jgi:broad specificity phosphatase PhoE